MNGAAPDAARRRPRDPRTRPLPRLPRLAAVDAPRRRRRDRPACAPRLRAPAPRTSGSPARRPPDSPTRAAGTRRRRRHHDPHPPLRRRSPPASTPCATETSTSSSSTPDGSNGSSATDEQLKAVVTGAIQLVAVRDRAEAAGIRRRRAARHRRAGAGHQRRARPGRGPEPGRRDRRVHHDPGAVRRDQHLRGHGPQRRRRGEVEPHRRGAPRPHAGPQPAGRQDRRHRPPRARPDRGDGDRRARRRRRSPTPSTSPQCAAASSPGPSCGSCSATPSTPRCSAPWDRSRRAPRTRPASPGRSRSSSSSRFLVSFAAIGSVDTTWARLVSWFPLTAPLAMPNRIAMGAATWWDPAVRRRPHARGHRRPRRPRRPRLHASDPPHRRDAHARRGLARRTTARTPGPRHHHRVNGRKEVPAVTQSTPRETRTELVLTVIAIAVGGVVFVAGR